MVRLFNYIPGFYPFKWYPKENGALMSLKNWRYRKDHHVLEKRPKLKTSLI